MGVYFDFFLFLVFRTSVNILGGEEKERKKRKQVEGERGLSQRPLTLCEIVFVTPIMSCILQFSSIIY
jgi:hypothetical protein